MNKDNQLFKKIKSIFIEDDLSGKESNTSAGGGVSKQEGTEGDPIVSESKQTPTGGSNQTTTKLEIDPKFNELLMKAIETNNLDGFDYLEFKNSLKSVEKVIPDEAVRYTSAFEMAKTMGLTKDKLISTAEHYASILTTEAKKFQDAVENQRRIQVGDRQSSIEKLNQAVKDKQVMIEKLQAEMKSAEQNLKNLNAEIDQAELKISNTEKQFAMSYQLINNQIKDDINKIKSYLS